MGPEAKIEDEARRLARKHGIYTRKFTSPGHTGVPDRLFIFEGIVLFIEFKAEGEEPDPLQAREIRKLMAQGVLATWADNMTMIAFMFKAMRERDVEDLILVCQKRMKMLGQ